MLEWKRIQSTADIELMADPFDTWRQFETPVNDGTEPSQDDIDWTMRRDEYEPHIEDDSF